MSLGRSLSPACRRSAARDYPPKIQDAIDAFGGSTDCSDKIWNASYSVRTALGFRAHSGWAAMVAVAGTIDAPRVVERRRIAIADPERPGSKQPYHAAAKLALADAARMIDEAMESSRLLAQEAVTAAVQALRSRGHEVIGTGVLFGSGKALPVLARVLGSHALIHTAEGEMFRESLVWAATQCGLPVASVKEREIDATLLDRIASLGKLIGPPWTQDQKYATAVALSALGDVKRRRPGPTPA